jgi:hypothetical protein
MALQWQAKCAEYGGEEEALETGEERGGGNLDDERQIGQIDK